MDYRTFLAHLRQLTHYKWQFAFTPIRPIRAAHPKGPFCPITAVCRFNTGKSYKSCNVGRAGEAIGLTPELVTQIMNAADNWTGHDANIRRDLLQAVGLTEESE